MKRAQEPGLAQLRIHDFRDWTTDRHRRVDEEISIGDHVLTNGAIAAVVVTDAVVGLIPAVLGDERSPVEESVGEQGLLEAPHYIRPPAHEGIGGAQRAFPPRRITRDRFQPSWVGALPPAIARASVVDRPAVQTS